MKIQVRFWLRNRLIRHEAIGITEATVTSTNPTVLVQKSCLGQELSLWRDRGRDEIVKQDSSVLELSVAKADERSSIPGPT